MTASPAREANDARPRPDGASGIVLAWVDLYTRGLRPEIRSNRRQEIEADLWSEAEWAAVAGRSPSLTTQRLGRLIRGAPADIAWRLEIPNAKQPQGRRIVTPSPAQLIALGAAGLMAAVGFILAGVGVINPDPARWDGWGPLGLTFACAIALVAVGLAVWRPLAGVLLSVLAAIAAILASPWIWALVLVLPAATGYRWLASRERTTTPAA